MKKWTQFVEQKGFERGVFDHPSPVKKELIEHLNQIRDALKMVYQNSSNVSFANDSRLMGEFRKHIITAINSVGNAQAIALPDDNVNVY